MKTCDNCGNEIRNKAIYCDICGNFLGVNNKIDVVYKENPKKEGAVHYLNLTLNLGLF